jgi:DNA-binding transcriptional ArsR family regulator
VVVDGEPEGEASDPALDRALDEVLEALANPHRRDMVYLLGLQPWAVNQLARIRGLSLPAIHKHLKILENAGLVSRRKQGRTTYLTLDPRPLQLLQTWVGQFHPYWSSTQATYENYARHLGLEPPTDPATDPAADPPVAPPTP